MSRTDKTAPWWVKAHDPSFGARLEHDHAGGECRVESLADARRRVVSRTSWWRHERQCERFDVETRFCDPGDTIGCMAPWRVRFAQREGLPAPTCAGHLRLYAAHPDVPCEVCDAPPPPTCTPRWARRYAWELRKIHGRSMGRAAKRLPEKSLRAASRNELREAAKEWNATGDVEAAIGSAGLVRRPGGCGCC